MDWIFFSPNPPHAQFPASTRTRLTWRTKSWNQTAEQSERSELCVGSVRLSHCEGEKKHQLIRNNVRFQIPEADLRALHVQLTCTRESGLIWQTLSELLTQIIIYSLFIYHFSFPGAGPEPVPSSVRLVCAWFAATRLACAALALSRCLHPAHISSCSLCAASCNIQQPCRREESVRSSEYDPALLQSLKSDGRKISNYAWFSEVFFVCLF